MQVELKVNGRAVTVDVEPRRTLLDCLREAAADGQGGLHGFVPHTSVAIRNISSAKP